MRGSAQLVQQDDSLRRSGVAPDDGGEPAVAGDERPVRLNGERQIEAVVDRVREVESEAQGVANEKA